MAPPTTGTPAQAGLPLPPTHGPTPMGMRLVIDIEGHYRIVGMGHWLPTKDIGPSKAQDAL